MKKYLLYLIPLALAISANSLGQTVKTKAEDPITKKDYFDEAGQVYIKLYKKEDSIIQYWELWNMDDKNAMQHWGRLGNYGEHSTISGATHPLLKDMVNSLISEMIHNGYREIPLEQQFTVEITFKLKNGGSPADLKRREDIRNMLTEFLGWTGNGRCDDADIGSGEMTLYADVIDPYLAIKAIPLELKEKNISDEYYFTITQGKNVIKDNIKPKIGQ